MNTMQSYSQTSWGRILLMLRADCHTFGRGLLMFFGMLVLMINFVLRLGGLFGFGFQTTFLSPIDVVGRFGLMGALIAVFQLIYIHTRIQIVKPTPFTLIPTNLWEKITSIIIGCIVITLGFFLMIYLTVFIDWLFAPEVVSLGLRLEGLTFPIFDPITWDETARHLALKFGGLSSFLIICTQLIRYKSSTKALLLGILYNTLLWFVLGKLIYHMGKYLLSLEGGVEQTIEALLSNPDTSLAYASYSIMGFFLVLDLALAYYIYYRLKKLEI